MPHANQLIQQSQPRLRGLSPAPTAQLHRANGRPGSAIRGPAPSPLPAPAPGRAPHLWSALCGPTPPTFATPCPRTWRTAPPTRARSDRRPTAPLPWRASSARAAAGTPSADRSSDGVADVADLMGPGAARSRCSSSCAIGASSSAVGISKLARGGCPISLQGNTAPPPGGVRSANSSCRSCGAPRGPLPVPWPISRGDSTRLVGGASSITSRPDDAQNWPHTRRKGEHPFPGSDDGFASSSPPATAAGAASHSARGARACHVRAGALSPATSTMIPHPAAAVVAVGAAAVWND